MRILILFFVVLFSSNAYSQIEEPEFIRRMTGHKIGVDVICAEIINDFPGLRAAYAMARCRAHDLSKVNQDAKFLEKHGLSKERSIASYLSEIYGRFVPETQVNRGIIDETNRVDDAIAKAINEQFQATPVERRLADVMEHVADLTERGMHEKMFPPADGIFERARPMIPASRYFAENPVELKNWSSAERALMIRIAEQIEGDPAVKLKLIKSINPVAIERTVQPLEARSYFHQQRLRRADCFEALLRAPLPGA